MAGVNGEGGLVRGTWATKATPYKLK
ncbi:protein of unknown function [Kyrpidia spormannii]|uniref:Uncharacterized protein n=1 Tax=Kyrpidia spormannii TaxID=2055160 RepID=A0A6F9EE25_9BACL|nr:protein of unknown function [Kyrpidia spormannii]